MARLGRFLALQAALAVSLLIALLEVDTLNTSGEWKIAGNWSGGKPTSASEVLVPAGKVLKIATEASARAMIVEGTVEGTAIFSRAAAAESTEAAFKGVALKIVSTATVSSWTGSLSFAQTGTIKTLGIWSGGKTLQSANGVQAAVTLGRGSWQLEEPLTLLAAAELTVQPEATFLLNSQNLSVGRLEVQASSTVTAGATTIKLTGVTAEAKPVLGAAAGLSAASATIEVTDTSETEKRLNAGNLSYGTITFAGPNIVLNEGATIGTANVNNKGAAATKGLRIKQGTTVSVTTITFNGTGTERSRLESSEAGKPATLKIPSSKEVGGAVAVKDIAVTGGTLTLTDPNAKDEGGNTGIVFAGAAVPTTLGMIV